MNTFIKNNSLLSTKTKLEYTYNPNNLVLLYNTSLGNGANTIYVPVQGTSPNVIIDWGDGLSDTYTTIGYKSHTYATSGTYVVQISGTMRTLSHSATIPVIGSKEKLIQCLSFGNIGLNSLGGGFDSCTNLTKVPSSIPTAVTNLQSLFIGCVNFNDISISDWNTSNVSIMTNMFVRCSSFNQNLTNWNVGKVNNFGNMFSVASIFNGNLSGWNIGSNVATPSINMSFMFDRSGFNNNSISNWNVGKVNNMQSMFASSSFNQNINNWNVSNVINMSSVFSNNTTFNQPLNNWNTSSATTMSAMFINCTNFNQPLNNWNVSKVTSFNQMFNNCDSFNQNLESWNLSGINTSTGLTGFMQFATGLSTANYDALLIGWNANKASYRTDLRPNFGGSKYSVAGADAREALTTYGWFITDGGFAP
jgi:surface protein